MSPPLALTSPRRRSMAAASGTLTAAATPGGASTRSDCATAMTVTGPLVFKRFVDRRLVEGGLLVAAWLAIPGASGGLVPGEPGWLDDADGASRGSTGDSLSPPPCPAPGIKLNVDAPKMLVAAQEPRPPNNFGRECRRHSARMTTRIAMPMTASCMYRREKFMGRGRRVAE